MLWTEHSAAAAEHPQLPIPSLPAPPLRTGEGGRRANTEKLTAQGMESLGSEAPHMECVKIQLHPSQNQQFCGSALCQRTPNLCCCCSWAALPWSGRPGQRPGPSAHAGDPSPGCPRRRAAAAWRCLCWHEPGPACSWFCESSCSSRGLSGSLLWRSTRSGGGKGTTSANRKAAFRVSDEFLSVLPCKCRRNALPTSQAGQNLKLALCFHGI